MPQALIVDRQAGGRCDKPLCRTPSIGQRVGDPVADAKRGRASVITAICVDLLATVLQAVALRLAASSSLWGHLF
jgi:hypothetical protein